MKTPYRKPGTILRIVAICMILILTSIFAGCSGATGEKTTLQNTMVSEDVNSHDSSDEVYIDSADSSDEAYVNSSDSSDEVYIDSSDSSDEVYIDSSDSSDEVYINSSDYVALGDYEGFEVRVDGLDVYVGEELVSVPYRDESFGTEYALQFYYSQVDPAEDRTNWVIPTDEDIVQIGIPGIMSYSDLKDYVLQKINENDEITSFMIIGDAAMEQVVANSTFTEIPEDVIRTCEDIYTDYLEEMLSRYNEIGEIPDVQKDGNSAYKVLAAMAIAKEAGIDINAFDYEEVLKYLVQ